MKNQDELSYIYMATCKTTGLSYIGQTKDFDTRRHQHYLVSQNLKIDFPLYNAIREYGWEDIEWQVITTCEKKDRNKLERYYIKEYGTNVNGYNVGKGGNYRFPMDKQYIRDTISRKNKEKAAETGQNKGEKNPMFGKGYKVAGEKNGHYGKDAARKGTYWMNNGKDQMRVYPPWDKDMLIFGWQYGRLDKAWNKGLTKETDERVAAYCKTRQKK